MSYSTVLDAPLPGTRIGGHSGLLLRPSINPAPEPCDIVWPPMPISDNGRETPKLGDNISSAILRTIARLERLSTQPGVNDTGTHSTETALTRDGRPIAPHETGLVPRSSSPSTSVTDDDASTVKDWHHSGCAVTKQPQTPTTHEDEHHHNPASPYEAPTPPFTPPVVTGLRPFTGHHSDGASNKAKARSKDGVLLLLSYLMPSSLARHFVGVQVEASEKRSRNIQALLTQRLSVDRIITAKHPSAASGIHVFVDTSNIIIGFYCTLAHQLGIPKTSRFSPAPSFDFKKFSKILERGRPVHKAVAVGSMNPAHTQRPQYFDQAEAIGYLVDVRKRIPRETSTDLTDKLYGNKSESEDVSDSYDGIPTRRRVGLREDRVDEAIHLRMSESLLDATRPGTIVLATGDAAVAEASGGFLKFVDRALRHGWCVEIVSWRTSLSSSWKKKDWCKKWGNRFSILELDIFAPDLLASPKV